MPRDFSRTDRISEQMQRSIAVILQREMKDPRVGMVTVNSIKISRDLSVANVYISLLNLEGNSDSEKMIKVLSQASGFIRSRLAEMMHMRAVPMLRFHYDNTIENGRYLSDLIDKAMSQESKKSSGGTDSEA